MDYLTAANILTGIHTVLVVAVMLGILISAKCKRFRPVESIVLLAAIIVWSLYGGCPLTYLENSLRIHAGQTTSLLSDGFIPFYVREWFGFSITNTQLVITTYITAIVYFCLSIERLRPVIHFEIIKVRKSLRKRAKNR